MSEKIQIIEIDHIVTDTNAGANESDYVVDEPICCRSEQFEYYYENNEYYNENYVKNGFIRGITISKWPNVGFGFNLDKCIDKKFYCINDIVSDSPAEACLTVGDLIVEIDELNPMDEFGDLDDLNTYLSKHDTIHLMALNQLDFDKFQSKFDLSLKNYEKNCEDIVIVQWSQLNKEA